jgi:hypothetical protein
LKEYSILLRVFAGDVAATVLVWFFSIVFENSSIYDPYWSVFPIVMIVFFDSLYKSIHAGVLMLLYQYSFGRCALH